MGGVNSGVSQASPAERRVLESQLESLAWLNRAIEATERELDSLRHAQGHLRRANGRLVKLYWKGDTLTDVEPEGSTPW